MNKLLNAETCQNVRRLVSLLDVNRFHEDSLGIALIKENKENVIRHTQSIHLILSRFRFFCVLSWFGSFLHQRK